MAWKVSPGVEQQLGDGGRHSTAHCGQCRGGRAAQREVALKRLELTHESLNTFLEWRYRMLTRFMLMVGGSVALAQWLVVNGLGWYVIGLLFVVAAWSLVMSRADGTNATHIRNLYRLGNRLELKLVEWPLAPRRNGQLQG